jgi:oligopeptide/dipeptide ABC transporter ATP-binding protein
VSRARIVRRARIAVYSPDARCYTPRMPRPEPPPAARHLEEQSAGSSLLEVRDLRTHFFTEDGVAKAVDGVTLSLAAGETLGVVGESGCGKSVTALSILRLVAPPGKIVGGKVLLGGRDLLALSEREMRDVRGNRISMIFQEPMTSLNPVFTVGSQIMEAILVHERVSQEEARARAIEMLRKVRIPAAEARVDDYPHQMSGGMRQRVMIAMALALSPEVLIADEPTTALDVTIQAQIMDLLAELKRDLGMSVLLITHNLALVAEVAGRIAVMYAAKVVEYASARDLFAAPLHPYTHGLLASVPTLGMAKTRRLNVIPGVVPNPLRAPGGCPFHPRCPVAEERCRTEAPPLIEERPGHLAACHRITAGRSPIEGTPGMAAEARG